MKIEERLNKITKIIEDKDFSKNKGLGNEISFYIFDYDPKYEILVRYHLDKIIKNIKSKKIKEFNLYDMLIEMLKKENLIDVVLNMEKNEGSEELLEAIKTFAPPDAFIEKIAEESKNTEIILITGVGQIYPFVRSHTILNKLHSVIENKPLILFYPGKYDGQKLELFNKLKDDNYYRAFPLIN
ncbi:DUF1788 domain-containing protein [Marinitoga lauensis]|uniref:DUF1788 domain-containing protein n=1 Tax=Marinitoga lauensis TaxID=2201189 RepID=UPI001010B3D6|nr:DUF1788 domain-containing protein [Marinitoga lauensis]